MSKYKKSGPEDYLAQITKEAKDKATSEGKNDHISRIAAFETIAISHVLQEVEAAKIAVVKQAISDVLNFYESSVYKSLASMVATGTIPKLDAQYDQQEVKRINDELKDALAEAR